MKIESSFFVIFTILFSGLAFSAPFETDEDAANGICYQKAIESCESNKNLQVGSVTFDCVYSEDYSLCVAKIVKYDDSYNAGPSSTSTNLHAMNFFQPPDGGFFLLLPYFIISFIISIVFLYLANLVYYKFKGKKLFTNKTMIVLWIILGIILFVILGGNILFSIGSY